MIKRNTLPLVSVITPSFNQGNFLEKTIQSVLGQDYPNIEYIIIDGGSTDLSVDIIRKYESSISSWLTEPDYGQADAINKGFQRARGDFLCWINSDDTIYSDFISKRISQFERHKEVDFIYGDVHQGPDIDQIKIRKGRQTNFMSMLLSLNVPIPQQSTMWKRSVIEKVGILDPKWHVLLDREYFMRIARFCKIIYFPGTVAFFRNHDQSKSIAEEEKWAHEIPVFYQEVFINNLFDIENSVLKKHRKRVHARALLLASKISKKAGNHDYARSLLNSAWNQYKIYTFFILASSGLKNFLIRVKGKLLN